MLHLRKIRDLALTAASAKDRPAYLSAASGLVCIKSYIYVVADDELHLGVFRKGDPHPGTLLRLFDGELPAPTKVRKKAKPDFESLTRLAAFVEYPHGALLACGSGSRPNRRHGALIGLDTDGALRGVSRSVDLSCIMTPLAALFPALNIEGVAVRGGELLVFQRGNAKHNLNSVIRFPLLPFLQALTVPSPDPIAPLACDTFDLGRIGGIPLSFTDGTVLPDGTVVFAAVAEATDDAYQDGPCAGAAVGLIAADGALRWVQPVSLPYKIEGLDAECDGDIIRLLLVTDADDVTVPASLLSIDVRENGAQA